MDYFQVVSGLGPPLPQQMGGGPEADEVRTQEFATGVQDALAEGNGGRGPREEYDKKEYRVDPKPFGGEPHASAQTGQQGQGVHRAR